jgi:hypothetical protein
MLKSKLDEIRRSISLDLLLYDRIIYIRSSNPKRLAKYLSRSTLAPKCISLKKFEEVRSVDSDVLVITAEVDDYILDIADDLRDYLIQDLTPLLIVLSFNKFVAHRNSYLIEIPEASDTNLDSPLFKGRQLLQLLATGNSGPFLSIRGIAELIRDHIDLQLSSENASQDSYTPLALDTNYGLENLPALSCNMEPFDQEAEPGVDTDHSQLERFHVKNAYNQLAGEISVIKWRVIVTKQFQQLLYMLLFLFQRREQGRFLILGPSGSGKSFILYLVALYFKCMTEHNVHVVYLYDCLSWLKAPNPMQFFIDEVIFGLASETIGSDLEYACHFVSDKEKYMDHVLREVSEWCSVRKYTILFVFDQVD